MKTPNRNNLNQRSDPGAARLSETKQRWTDVSSLGCTPAKLGKASGDLDDLARFDAARMFASEHARMPARAWRPRTQACTSRAPQATDGQSGATTSQPHCTPQSPWQAMIQRCEAHELPAMLRQHSADRLVALAADVQAQPTSRRWAANMLQDAACQWVHLRCESGAVSMARAVYMIARQHATQDSERAAADTLCVLLGVSPKLAKQAAAGLASSL